MKKIVLILVFVFLLTSCGGKETNFVYTTTSFTNIKNESDFNDHFNTKQAKGSNVYNVIFKNRKDFERKLVTSSDKKIVYHDFCKVGNITYAVGGEFGLNKGTSTLEQVYPKIENRKLFSNNEIRFRDCEYLEEKGKKYIAIVSHGNAKIMLFDIENKKLVDEKIISYEGFIDGKRYKDITMIHEIIKADLDGDGNIELYFTVTSKNGDTNIDQRGKIYKAIIKNGKLETEEFYDLKEAYTKEVHRLILNNGKEVLLVSIQGRTKINPEKEKNIKPKARFKFKDGTEIIKKDIKKITDIIRPVELIALYLENGKLLKKSLTKIKTSTQCRTIETGNFFNEENSVDFILGCNRGAIRFFTLDNDLKLSNKKMLRIPEKQIHSFHSVDTDGDGKDEAFVGVDFDGLYHIDLKAKEKLFKIYDYSKLETWIWAIEGIE